MIKSKESKKQETESKEAKSKETKTKMKESKKKEKEAKSTEEETEQEHKPENFEKEYLDSIGFNEYESISDLMQKGVGKYFVVNILSKRAKDINLGSKPLVDVDDPTGECYPYAVAEIGARKLKIAPKKSTNKLIDLISEKQ